MPLMDGVEFLDQVIQWPELDLNQGFFFAAALLTFRTGKNHIQDREKENQYPISGDITKPLTQEIISYILH
jgi:hypothetical protein